MKVFNSTQGMLMGLALSISLVPIVQAHHGFAFEFDPEQQGTVSGVVTNVRFANPHVVYMMDVETVDGETEEWLLLTHNVGVMRNQGWDNQTVAVGDRIRIKPTNRSSPPCPTTMICSGWAVVFCVVSRLQIKYAPLKYIQNFRLLLLLSLENTLTLSRGEAIGWNSPHQLIPPTLDSCNSHS